MWGRKALKCIRIGGLCTRNNHADDVDDTLEGRLGGCLMASSSRVKIGLQNLMLDVLRRQNELRIISEGLRKLLFRSRVRSQPAGCYQALLLLAGV